MITAMFGGSFDPLHNVHIHCIEEALRYCDKLFIILSHCRTRDRIDYKTRASWLKEVTDEILSRECFKYKDIEIKVIEDTYNSKDEYNWEAGRNDILDNCGVNGFDVVYCGSDYRNSGIFENLYKTNEIKYIDRDDGISSTRIMQDVYRSDNWNSIPKCVQRYFLKRVLIIGGESVGKSTMTKKLAKVFDTKFVREIGRDVSNRSIDEYLMPDRDFSEILIRHKSHEYSQAEKANKLLFIDTDALTTLFYTHELISDPEIKDKTAKLAEAIADVYRDTYDLIIFLEVSEKDTPFIQDGTRNINIAANRKMYSDRLKSFYDKHEYKYVTVTGTYDERTDKVVELVKDLLKAHEAHKAHE